MSWLDDKLNEYFAWMRDNTIAKEDPLTGWSVISTPFTGLFNDNIQIYAKRENGEIILSDDGETLENLSLAGLDISRSQQRKQYFDLILHNYGVILNGAELTIKARENDFPRQKHNLISAIAEIGDMSVMAKHTVASMFKEDVQNYLDEQNIIYTPQFIAKGSTGLEFMFDFQIAGKEKEIVIKPFNMLTQGMVERFLFGWDDIRAVREKQSQKKLEGIAIINDTSTDPKPELIGALESKRANVILWSQRHTSLSQQKLKAS
jgi:hypothetical protein|nr:MAG TPA: protein of unknown function DUF1829 [Caudoviricetes sp.]